jgi:hypothetical protein
VHDKTKEEWKKQVLVSASTGEVIGSRSGGILCTRTLR